MPFFRYTVKDNSGKTLNGTMSARDEAEVSQRLKAAGYTVLAVAGAAPAAPSTGQITARAAAPSDHIPPSIEPRIPMRTLAAYLRQMAALVRAGLTPYNATQDILSRTRNRRLRRALESMEAQVRQGGHLAPAMAAYPDVFPRKTVGLIYCGELGGFLDKALDEAATDLEQEAASRMLPRLASGFFRLNIICGILLWPLLRLDIILVKLAKLAKPNDTISDSLRNAGHVLTQVVVESAWFILVALVLFLAATYTWPHIKRIPAVRSWLDAFILRFPLWGQLHESRSLSRFAKSLGQLYEAGISPAAAWAAASDSCPNSLVANRLKSAAAGFNRGETFSAALDSARVFDDESRGLLLAGERAGDMPEMLRRIAENKENSAAALQKRGRMTSSSVALISFMLLVGFFLIVMVYAYGKAVFKVPEAILGGG